MGDTDEALRIVLRKSLEVNGLVRGLSEVARTLDRRTAHLCILATDCEDASYKRLIEALCAQNNIDIIQVNEREKLAEWAGLVKKDREGNIKKHFKCSVVAIKDFGERTKSLECSCRSSRSKNPPTRARAHTNTHNFLPA